MIYILGRQPAIGLAEIESLYGSENIQPVGYFAVDVNSDQEIDFKRIGGALKVAKKLTTLETTEWKEVQKHLKAASAKHARRLPEGKLKLGISTYGFKVNPSKITALGLELKKSIRSSGRSVRLVPNSETALNSAQVLHNKLTGELGWELLIIINGSSTIIAQTTAVQDIDAYTLRDRGRPKRDARVGMLPPKLAQTIINIAAGSRISTEDSTFPVERDDANTTSESSASEVGMREPSYRLLDPFCGTGVVLQEAALMGYSVYGTDIDERMIRYSRDNLNWLSETHKISFDWYLHEGDATDTQWQKPIDIVACEGYLGRPFTSAPSSEILQKTINDCDTILRKFLKNIARQTKKGDRMCIAVPAWFVGSNIYHLKTLDQLADLGYNRISFVHSNEKDLIYHRDGQVVGRELLVISRK